MLSKLERLKDPACDLRFLLDRGYNRKTAINVVSNKYRLDSKDRNILYRTIFSQKNAKERKKKLVRIGEIKGREIIIDGYNVLITVESMLRKKELFLCDDGFVRDVSATFGKHKITKTTSLALEKILKALKENRPEKVVVVFDSKVSFSGEMCRLVRKKLDEFGLKGEAFVSDKTDFEIKNFRGIVCTSDTAVIEKAEKVLDLPSFLNPKIEVIK
jgi:hypothetical protein